MEDRELLELAARAAGKHYNPTRIDTGGLWCVVDGEAQEVQEIWNPLDSVSDALLMAGKLRLGFLGTNAEARRALVEMAAKIGKDMG